jgi:NitT/TauT family transport system ATP-binding protein
MTQPGPALQLKRVGKTFQARGGEVEALRPLDLEVERGELLCLLGPSGCGKSTLLSLIAGLEVPTTGSASVGGAPIAGTGTDRVLLFQDAALFPWLDVQGNVEFGLRQRGVPAAERRAIARRYLELVHLSGFERASVHQLSGGMRQRVALARALAIEPEILLMDEPFGALDALTRDLLQAELEAIWHSTRKTIVFVTHNVREAVALGDRIIAFSPRPGEVIGDFRLDTPRPRRADDLSLLALEVEILALLRRSPDAHARAA